VKQKIDMQKTKILMLALMLTGMAFPLLAQNQMSLEECRQQALKSNKALKKSFYQQEEALANQKLAKTAYFPKISASSSLIYSPDFKGISMPGYFLPTAESAAAANAGNFSGESNVWMSGISLDMDALTFVNTSVEMQMPVYAGGQIRNANKQANLGVGIAAKATQMTRAEVIEKTDRAYWNLIALAEQTQLAKSYVEMLTEFESQMEAMFELGLSPLSEKLKVSVQKNQAELNLIKAENGLKLSRMVMNQVLGLSLDRDFAAADSLQMDVAMPDVSKQASTLANQRPEIQILDARVQISEYDRKIASAEFLPQFGVSASYSNFYVKDIIEENNWNPQIAAQLSIPIFHWREGKHKRQAALMKIRQAEAELDETRDMILLEIAQCKLALNEALQTIHVARQNVSETEEALSEIQSSFELELCTTTDVLNAQTQWQQARFGLIRALADFEILKTIWQRVSASIDDGF
jgi:outer membrane protein